MDEPSILLSLSIGFILRIFLLAFNRRSPLRPTFVGIWEGIALYRGLSNPALPPINTYLPCVFRLLLFDCFTETRNTMIPLVFSLLLAVLISDIVGTHFQPSRRSNAKLVGTTRSPQIYESPRRANRMRVIPREMKETDWLAIHLPDLVMDAGIRAQNNRTVDFVNPAGVPPSIVRSPEPTQIEMPHDHPVILHPLTPPLSPPSTPRSGPHLVAISESGSHEDELQTPSLSVMPQTLTLDPEDGGGSLVDEDVDRDELQTPLALNLRDLPSLILEPDQLHDEGIPAPVEVIPSLASASLHEDTQGTDNDNLSELSFQTGTALSIISGENAPEITAAAEELRKQAWAEEAKKRQLQNLRQPASTKEAFLLRLEIKELEERAQSLHRRAARRHYRARNLSQRQDTIDIHGLFVAEAIRKVEASLQTAILNDRKYLHVIVGRGLHSVNGRPKLRPAIMAEMEK